MPAFYVHCRVSVTHSVVKQAGFCFALHIAPLTKKSFDLAVLLCNTNEGRVTLEVSGASQYPDSHNIPEYFKCVSWVFVKDENEVTSCLLLPPLDVGAQDSTQLSTSTTSNALALLLQLVSEPRYV